MFRLEILRRNGKKPIFVGNYKSVQKAYEKGSSMLKHKNMAIQQNTSEQKSIIEVKKYEYGKHAVYEAINMANGNIIEKWAI